MRTRCRNSDREVVELVGPRLSRAEDAVEALRLSAGTPDDEAVVVLVCDENQGVVLAVDFAGAGAKDAAQAIGFVLEALAGRRDLRLVVGIILEGMSPVLDADELDAVTELAVMCRAAAISLLDVIVVAGDEWCSLAEG